MATVSYPYLRHRIPPSAPFPEGQIVHRPMATANVIAPKGEDIRCLVCFDTGADACVFPLTLAFALKLDVLSLPKTITTGVGNTANVTYYANVTVDIGNGIAFPTYAGFTEGLNASGIGLLGQTDFFSRYDVLFSRKSNICMIEMP